MKTKVIIIAILSSFLFFSLSCEKETNEPKPFQSHSVDFTDIKTGILNGEEGITQSNMVITNTTDWQNLINQMNTINNVIDSTIQIDFDEFLVIAIFLEVKTSGWQVEISEIIENETNIVVSKIEQESATTHITQPFCIVKIPTTDKPIIFE